MNSKIKVGLYYPIIAKNNRKARKITKKLDREDMADRYPVQWRNDWVVKKCVKILKIINVKLEVIGYENIPKQPAILTPNHASSFDPVVLLAALTNPGDSPDDLNQKIIFIAKEELQKNKKMRGYAGMINTFYIKRNNPRQALKVINDALEEARNSHRHLVIFPEGTRSKDGKIEEFKGGAFKIAKKGFMPIVPVTINNSLSVTNLSRKKKLHVQVIFHTPIKPLSFMSSEVKGIATRVQKIVQSKWVKPEGKKTATDAKIA